MTVILGLNAFHGDSAACLVRDGELVAAAEEERFRRVKHWAGFPSNAIRYCRESAGVSMEDVDHIALNQDPRAHLGRKAAFALRSAPDPRLLLDRLLNKRRRAGVREQLAAAFPGQTFRGAVQAVEHHQAHLSSAFHVSPFEEAVVISVDGFGDFASSAWGVGRGGRIEAPERIFFPHSLGIFYQALTQFLGFPHYGDEYKVMGLASYGEPIWLDHMSRIVRLEPGGRFSLDLGYFRHHRERIAFAWEKGSPVFGDLFTPALEKLLGPRRRPGQPLSQFHRDIARSVQAMYEEAFFHLLRHLHGVHGIDNLALAGGCAMNSVANGKVFRESQFRNVYVQPAAGDAGGAIGAALSVWRRLRPDGARFRMAHAYWGPEFGDAEIGRILEASANPLAEGRCRVWQAHDEAGLLDLAASRLVDGKVVGWFQGRMEWGPRALGNRSILGDPRRPDMKEILNLKIKRRESFRPFAPSILREAVLDWFEEDDDVPFMMQVHQGRSEKRALVPAVTHVDGSGRLQTVTEDGNPRYYRLIRAFSGKTGVPMLLNTSFNENEPIVCRPEQALDCFLRTRMDLLVMGNWIIERRSG